jgi:GT2 family glycosyltransferase
VVLETAFERGHDLLWIMDDDVYSTPNALERLLASAERLEASGVRVGAVKALEVQWEADGGPMHPPFALPQTILQALRYRYMCPLAQPVLHGSPEPVRIAMLTLAGTLIPRVALASIGFPDPGYFYYGEDCDFGFRLLTAGFGVYLAPDAVVTHKGAGWRAPRYLDRVANWRYYYMYRNQWVIASRHRGLIGEARSLACRARILAGCMYRVASELGRGNPGAARMAVVGIVDAVLGRMGKGAPLPGDVGSPHVTASISTSVS